MAVGPDELIRPLTGLVFIPTRCRVTLLTSKEKTKGVVGEPVYYYYYNYYCNCL